MRFRFLRHNEDNRRCQHLNWVTRGPNNGREANETDGTSVRTMFTISVNESIHEPHVSLMLVGKELIVQRR